LRYVPGRPHLFPRYLQSAAKQVNPCASWLEADPIRRGRQRQPPKQGRAPCLTDCRVDAVTQEIQSNVTTAWCALRRLRAHAGAQAGRAIALALTPDSASRVSICVTRRRAYQFRRIFGAITLLNLTPGKRSVSFRNMRFPSALDATSALGDPQLPPARPRPNQMRVAPRPRQALPRPTARLLCRMSRATLGISAIGGECLARQCHYREHSSLSD
jgi:hypothetical protein